MSVSISLQRPPELSALHARFPDRWPFLLESTSRGGPLGRWSLALRVDPDHAPLVASPGQGTDFLHRFEAQWQQARLVQPARLPFEGGWFVYLGYEMAAAIEPTLKLPVPDDALPTAFARRCSAALLIDHALDAVHLVAEHDELLECARAEIAACLDEQCPGPVLAPGRLDAGDGASFMRGVERIHDYILAGDVFQVNLSRPWQFRPEQEPNAVDVYRLLSARNPAPFAGLARMPGGTVLSSSPERLFRADDRRVEVRPIAGTRPRGRDRAEDRRLREELLANAKERAEHLMLVDLERNDLGRICEAGSIRASELMIIESYAHVHHIVSNIIGRARPGTTPVDLIRAIFPGGTITGCPKVRCMEIIAELESAGRGLYTGSMGYLGLDGRMDLNILIRSMGVDARGVHFRTGAGIVADSDPAAELEETVAKARGLMQALGHA
ncbi:MAG: aminodeoxychorismate synthase component I [Wenzhouxiangellaceae bacterium]|nr:aminodeoxychorismate synthase component I [Wenzhouxiangellaceae bacterium]